MEIQVLVCKGNKKTRKRPSDQVSVSTNPFLRPCKTQCFFIPFCQKISSDHQKTNFLVSEEVKKHMKGTVKWYNPRKGYGFIEGEDGKDVFAHRTATPIGTFLKEGDQVEYQVENSKRGPKAINIKKL